MREEHIIELTKEDLGYSLTEFFRKFVEEMATEKIHEGHKWTVETKVPNLYLNKEGERKYVFVATTEKANERAEKMVTSLNNLINYLKDAPSGIKDTLGEILS